MKHTSILLRACALLLTAAVLLAAFTACGKPAATEPDTTEAFVSAAESVTADETVPEETTAAPEAETTEPQDVTEAPAETTAAQTEAETNEEVKKAPQTKEEIVALFNESVNAAKSGSKSIMSNYTLNTQTSDATLSNKMLQNIANKLISANMGYDKKKDHVTYSGKDAIRQNFPARGQDWASRLTAADVSKATCTEKDGVYTVTLYLVPDTTPNIRQGEGHAGKAFSAAAQRDVDRGCEPAPQRDMPAPPEFGYARRAVRVVEVLRQTQTHHFPQADCHLRIAPEVEVELQSIVQKAQPDHRHRDARGAAYADLPQDARQMVSDDPLAGEP